MTTHPENLSVGSATLPSMTNTQTASTDHIRIPDADLDRPIAATVPANDPARVVTTDGVVFVDADMPPHGWTDTGIQPMSAAQARKLAAQLIAAADELDTEAGGEMTTNGSKVFEEAGHIVVTNRGGEIDLEPADAALVAVAMLRLVLEVWPETLSGPTTSASSRLEEVVAK